MHCRYMGFDFAGSYTPIRPNALIECVLGNRMLTVDFFRVDQGVKVRETFDSELTHSEEQQRQGWQAILDSFKPYVEQRS